MTTNNSINVNVNVNAFALSTAQLKAAVKDISRLSRRPAQVCKSLQGLYDMPLGSLAKGKNAVHMTFAQFLGVVGVNIPTDKNGHRKAIGPRDIVSAWHPKMFDSEKRLQIFREIAITTTLAKEESIRLGLDPASPKMYPVYTLEDAEKKAAGDNSVKPLTQYRAVSLDSAHDTKAGDWSIEAIFTGLGQGAEYDKHVTQAEASRGALETHNRKGYIVVPVRNPEDRRTFKYKVIAVYFTIL